MPAAWQPPEAERRRLTVLFCDLIASTRLSGRVDPEYFSTIVRDYYQTCVEVINKYDGYVCQYLGDGILVLFGYPLAHEDDGRRALHTCLGILDAMAQLNQRHQLPTGERLAVRMGVHTGVVVMSHMERGDGNSLLALGETPNLAARLQGFAEHDSIVISHATYQLTGSHFSYEALGPQPLRHIAEPVHLYKVLGAQPRSVASLLRDQAPFVGRGAELQRLTRKWHAVERGQGHLMLIRGDAGIGKSRLLEEFKQSIPGRGHIRLECNCSPYYNHTSLYPFVETIQHMLQWRDDSSVNLQKLQTFLTHYGLDGDEYLSLFADFFSLPSPHGQRLGVMEKSQAMFEAIVTLLPRLSRGKPLLLVVEDLQWADPTTIKLLTFLLESTSDTALFMLLTSRPEFETPWSASDRAAEIVLERLDNSQVAKMVSGLLATRMLPEQLQGQIVNKTDGIPLFVEEFTKFLVEAESHSGPPVVSASGRITAIPATLHDLLMSRLDRLATLKRTVRMGATIGRKFSYELLRAATDIDERELQADLRKLVEADILFQSGEPPDAIYRFKHALIRDVAYDSLLRSTRQAFHRSICHALESEFQDRVARRPELLAQHALMGELWDKACGAYLDAANRSMSRSAHQEAVDCLRNALDTLQHVADERATRERAIDIRLKLRACFMQLGQFAEVLEVLNEAQGIAEVLGDRVRQGQIAGCLANLFSEEAQLDKAMAAGRLALKLGLATGNEGLLHMANRYIARAHHAMGDYRKAAELLRESVSKGNALAAAGLAKTSQASTAYLLFSLGELGAFDEGIKYGEAGLAIARESGSPFDVCVTGSALGYVYLLRGELPSAIEHLEEAHNEWRRVKIPVIVPIIMSSLGTAHVLTGRVQYGLQMLEQVVERATSLKRMLEYSRWLARLGQGYLHAGRVEEARRCAQEAVKLARDHGERGQEAWGLRLLSLAHADGQPDNLMRTRIYSELSLKLAQELGMAPLHAHCLATLGQVAGALDEPEQAAEYTSQAIAMYRRLGMSHWLDKDQQG